MSIEAINEQLLRAIGAGVAILDPDELSFRFYNQTFSDWFETAAPGAAFAAVFPDLDRTAVIAALDGSGRFVAESSFRRKRRTLVIALTFTRTDAGVVLLECQNITRMRELETMIESYSSMVERNTRELQREKERVEKLLLNIMPRSVYEEYKTFGTVTPQSYEPVSVLTLDFVDFDETAREVGPAVMVSEMNDIYAAFDRIGEQFGCERIKTVGDSYVAISGLPEPMDDHAESVANAALRFVRYLQRRNDSHPHSWKCRIGLASGSVIGSVVGIQKYVYDVFGPAVNLASRLRDHAEPMQIIACDLAIASSDRDLLIEDLGDVELMGFGRRRLQRVEGAPSITR
ncbi:MAG: adenylate/guanylate cyclase domain-containing protein [Pseudomonadota bacterium]